MRDTPEINSAVVAIRSADALLITAGAGMGVDSGLPDFRGTEGFWKAYPPYRHLGLGFAQLANPIWFEQDPALAWGFYGHRMNLYRETVPHGGFALLRKWATRIPHGAHVFTSNVDGQFQKAGFADNTVTECHGSIHHLQCSQTCTDIWSAGATKVQVDAHNFRAHGDLPKCPTCGALARPNILMFGDDGWLHHRSSTQEEHLQTWLRNNREARLVVIECGAGTAIPTVRMFSERSAMRAGATLIRINIREPSVRGDGISIASGASAALSAIDQLL